MRGFDRLNQRDSLNQRDGLNQRDSLNQRDVLNERSGRIGIRAKKKLQDGEILEL